MTHALQVLIADDHPLLRAQFPPMIASQGDMALVGVVADGGAAIEAARALPLDVIVMDLSMPVLNGIEATAQLQALGLAARVVVWTTHEEHARVAAVRAAGGRGFVLKRSPISA